MGIDNIQVILKAIIEEVKKRNASPFIVTAMGSHGGATAEDPKKCWPAMELPKRAWSSY